MILYNLWKDWFGPDEKGTTAQKSISAFRSSENVTANGHGVYFGIYFFWIWPGLSSSTRYTSSYRPRKVAAQEIPAVDFVKFNFTKTTYSTNSEGDVNKKIHAKIYEIEVGIHMRSKHWYASTTSLGVSF